jgi:nitroreductase
MQHLFELRLVVMPVAQTESYLSDKIAQTGYPVLPLIAQRWSPRAFDPEQRIAASTLARILEASRWAASSFNEQPWRFIVGDRTETPDTLALLQACLVDGNKWAKQCPVLILAVAKNDFTQTGAENRHAWHDVGMAVSNLVLQAQHEGVYAHMMAGFYAHKAHEFFGIPEDDYSPVVMIALGYPGNPSQLTEEWQQKAEVAPRYRRPLQELIFAGAWDRPYPGLFS